MQIRLVLLCALVSVAGFAAQKTWNGQITDSMCGADHAGMGDMGKSPKDCTAACVKSGAKYEFISEGKVYEIANLSSANLKSFKDVAGKTVNLSGDLASDGKTITVAKIAAQ